MVEGDRVGCEGFGECGFVMFDDIGEEYVWIGEHVLFVEYLWVEVERCV